MDNYANMYPELYNRVEPIVNDCINRHINELPAQTLPSNEKLDEMVNEIYDELVEELPELKEDIGERRNRTRSIGMLRRPFYGRGRLARDFIALLLLGSLFRRRRTPYYGYGYGPGFRY